MAKYKTYLEAYTVVTEAARAFKESGPAGVDGAVERYRAFKEALAECRDRLDALEREIAGEEATA
ncbi:hypothetical protein [Methylobacterium sp.]|uniref:hypothetical protein n=1 Tax=Methylobacterium sp. TaxID=409 RepID=UPI000C3B3C67|nr:hypothetical protein [Methylobacterium sp.]MBP29019.1 hypothetical protein [Methylobacterium sp.]